MNALLYEKYDFYQNQNSNVYFQDAREEKITSKIINTILLSKYTKKCDLLNLNLFKLNA